MSYREGRAPIPEVEHEQRRGVRAVLDRPPLVDVADVRVALIAAAGGGGTTRRLPSLLRCDADERIVGMHLVGDHAAEVMQGFALALRLGATKADVDATIGIHPCVAENVVGVKVTKRSGEDPAKTAC